MSAYRVILLLVLVSLSAFCLAAVEIPVKITVPQKGLLSLGIYDQSGMLIRSLAYAKEVGAGPLSLTWDATTDLGVPAKPGAYQVRGVSFPAGPKVNFRMKVGVSGTPPYLLPNGLGSWGGNLGSPMDLCSNGKQLVAIFGCVEDNVKTGVQLMDADGIVLRRFQTFFPWDIRHACTMDEKNLYVAISYIGGKRLVVAKYDLDNSRGKVLADIPAGQHGETGGRWKDRWTTEVRGLAVANGRVYVPVILDDRLFVVNADDGKILNTVDVASPRGVAATAAGIFLLSGGKLLQLDADGKPQRTVIAAGLDDPSGLAIDAAGRFYIADGGKAQQVKVFSPEGKLLRAIGKTGGRPRNGKFDPAGMLEPRGICLGPNNTLWVAEAHEDFQRVSVWDAADGNLKKEFFSTRISAGQGRLAPDNKEMLFCDGVFADTPSLSAYAVDFARGTWAPAWHIEMPVSMMSQDDVLLGNTHIYGQLATSFNGHHPYLDFTGGLLKAKNGRTYAFGQDFSVWLFDEQAKSVKLAALVYTHRAQKLPDGRFQGEYDTGANNWMAWSDLNGDGKMAVDECTYAQNPPLLAKTSRLFGCELQPDLSLLMLCPISKPDKSLGWSVYRLPARTVLPSGVPVYDWADLQEVSTLQVPSFAGGDGWKGGANAYLHDISMVDNMLYTYAEPITSTRLELPGVDFWSRRHWRQTAMIFDPKTGKSAWQMLGHRVGVTLQPGQMLYPLGICANIDGFVFIPDTSAQMWVWTQDGLYIGKLYHNSWEGIFDADSIFIEETGAYAYKINGKVYACSGDHGVSVHEVELPKLATVAGGTVQVTNAESQAAAPWDPDGPPPGKKPLYAARSIYDPQARKNLRTINIDGVLDNAEWKDVREMAITQDNAVVARVRALFDNESLYLAYAVTDPNGLRNAGTELPTCPFTSGSYVDFRLGRDWTTPNRAQVLDGDMRVILARITGNQVADYQMGFWPCKPGGKHPQEIISPAAQQHFDDIAPVEGLKFAYKIAADSYTLEVAVPFRALGMNPARQSQVGFDVSVGFANPEGTLRRRTAHWAGENEATVVDRPTSSELRPATWGTLLFDPTPLPAAP